MSKVSCVIPAYNEGKRIRAVLQAVYGHPLIDEVLVVNDGSSDETGVVVKEFKEIKLITHLKNKGKSQSVVDGILQSSGDLIFLLDADLSGLTAQNITDLIEPVISHKADVSLSFKNNAWPLFPFKKIDYLSGDRVLPKSLIIPTIETMSALPSYGLEVFLNRIIIKNKAKIAVVPWQNVENNFSQKKRGWIKGVIVIIGIWTNILSTVSLFEMYAQNFKMSKLLVR